MSSADQNGWGDYAALWKTQKTEMPDLVKLRCEAASARLRAWWVSIIEVASLAVAALVAWHFIGARQGSTRAMAVIAIALAGVAAFTAWTLWNRRWQWRRVALSPDALIASQIERVRASLRFWRVNTAVMLALGAGVALLALAHAAGWIDGLRPGRWWMLALGNVPIVAVSLLWGRRRDAALRRRLEDLEALRRQLVD